MWCRFLFIFLALLLWEKNSKAQPGKSPSGKFSRNAQVLLEKKLPLAGDSATLVLATTDIADFLAANPTLHLLYQYAPTQTIVVKAAVSQLRQVFSTHSLVFADTWRQPKEEITTGAFDPTANQINLAHHLHPFINGSGNVVSIKENRFDKTDIDLKGRWFTSGTEAALSSTHATIMATLIAGGGNSSPAAKGVAWGTTLASSDFLSLLPDADTVYRNNAVSVQNHSYGVGIENFYGSDAAAYDMSVFRNPTLVHVFSAGNSGTATPDAGTYAGLPGYANLTGSFKMAKNVLVVGAIDSFGNVVAPSSKGPAFDGRVKPDLVAYGEGGSSGAAAVVSGAAALLQQAYRQANAGALPPASLVKAVLINSAVDIGAPQVDYAAGFGNVNVNGALQAVLHKRFFTEQVTGGETKKLMLHVPANTRQLKITVAWTDTASTPGVEKALTNNLDAQLTAAGTQQVWLPWVLSTAATKDSLAKPAHRGVDSLNNVEQITVDSPLPGNYQLEITGAQVKTQSQAFSVAYQIDTANHFAWTFPTASDPLIAGTKTLLRWGTTSAENGHLEYTPDGIAWQRIAASVPLAKGFYSWETPLMDTLLQLRMVVEAAGQEFSSDTVAVTKPLSKMAVGFDCSDSLLLYWPRIGTTTQLYRLGEFYMEPFLRTADTAVILDKQQQPSPYYAAAPVVKGKEGKRSAAIHYQRQGVGCYFASFLAQLQNNTGLLSAQLGSSFNVKEIQFLKATTTGYKLIKTALPVATLAEHTDSLLTAGMNTYQVRLVLHDGRTITSNPETIYYFPSSPVIVFPNPARQQEPVKVMALASDEFRLEVFDATGKMVHTQQLTDVVQTLPSNRFGKGLYFIKITSGSGEIFTTKLLVY